MVLDHEAQLEASGKLAERRARGNVQWMRELISGGLTEIFQSRPTVAALLPRLEQEVRSGTVTPLAASRKLLKTPSRP
jgi:LAO/AO transport system kinase